MKNKVKITRRYRAAINGVFNAHGIYAADASGARIERTIARRVGVPVAVVAVAPGPCALAYGAASIRLHRVMREMAADCEITDSAFRLLAEFEAAR